MVVLVTNLKNKITKARVLATLAFVVSIFLVSWIEVDELPKAFKKKIDKEITQLWSEEGVLTSVKVNETLKVQLSKFGAQGVFEIKISSNKTGYMVLAKAKSKFEFFDYAVFYDENKNIKAVRVLQYREDYGGEIGSKRWLRQFDGLNSKSPIEIDNDIQGISGATISYLAITKGVKNLTQLMSTL